MDNIILGTPQYNDINESMNHTLLERAKHMCIQSSLPKNFWTKVINITYLVNCSQSVPLKHKTP